MPDEFGTALTALATATILAVAALLNKWVQAYRQGHSTEAPSRKSGSGNGQKRLANEEGWEKYAMTLSAKLRGCEQREDLREAEFQAHIWSIRQENYEVAQRILSRAQQRLKEDEERS